MLAYFHSHPASAIVLGTVLSGAFLMGASRLERSSRVVKWCMTRDLLQSKFYDSNKRFSLFQNILSRGEKPFHRPELLKSLVKSMKGCLNSSRGTLIVGGVSGCGKSVFWERVLAARPVSSDAAALPVPPTDTEALELHQAWSGFAGPTRVINLQTCTTIESFESQVVDVFHPKPWLPNFTFRDEPTATSTLDLLRTVLQNPRFQKTPLIVYVEDVHRFPRFAGSDMRLASQFFRALELSNNALVVGNSSSVPAFHQFKSVSHFGVRTNHYFFPTLESSDPRLMEFTRRGGRLYSSKSSTVDIGAADASKLRMLEIWGGNLLLLKHSTSRSIAEFQTLVRNKLSNALSDFCIPNGSEHFGLISSDQKKDTRVLTLRRQLLQRLVDEGGKVRVDLLPWEMAVFQIPLQLAALEMVSFSTEYDPKLKSDVEYIIPYYPYVLTAFCGLSDSSASTRAS